MEKFISPYSPITNEDKAEMLKSIGINSQSELFSDLPQKFINPSLNLPESISEFDLLTERSIPKEASAILIAGPKALMSD